MFQLARLSSKKFSTSALNFANSRVFFDMSIDNKSAGRVTFELYDDVVPKTAENFKQLCIGQGSGKNFMGYRGSIFHRIIPSFMCQGGDFTHHNGTGGRSIYGAKFRDENFTVKHTKPGQLSMANAGPHTNGSQFFITTIPCGWLDNKHVVFGEVIEGMSVIKDIERLGSQSGRPRANMVVED